MVQERQVKALSAEDDAKLIFGTVFSLRNMVRKLGGVDDKWVFSLINAKFTRDIVLARRKGRGKSASGLGHAVRREKDFEGVRRLTAGQIEQFRVVPHGTLQAALLRDADEPEVRDADRHEDE